MLETSDPTTSTTGVKPAADGSADTTTQYCIWLNGEEVPYDPNHWPAGFTPPAPGPFLCTTPAPTSTTPQAPAGDRWWSDPRSNGSTVDDYGTTGTSSIVKTLTADYAQNRFNPPPHYSARRISPTTFTNYDLTDLSTSQRRRIENAMSGSGTFNKRGFLIQDPDSAVYQSGSKQGQAKSAQDLWGFQFMYNPTLISHSNSSSTSYDFTNSQDVFNLMIGTQTISLNLLLNRIPDMSGLKANGSATTTFTNSLSGYPRQLNKKEQLGILKRGTEFDLEFLYRTINGDPEANSPLTKGNPDLETADFGYLYGSLMWLVMHDHLRYKVYISGVNVTHVMFSENMVPILTNVDLTFVRVPAPTFGSSTDLANWFDNRTNSSNPALKKDATDPASTAGTS